jgi:ABC-2 type transport system ATP-binding protein
MTTAAISIKGLEKRFKNVDALRGLDLQVPAGSICGFLGRNGAGKTTTLKIMLDMLRPDAGEVFLLGESATDRDTNVRLRERVAFVSDRKDLYPYMTVDQMIRFTRGFFPKWRGDLEAKLRKTFELPGDRKTNALSRGTLTKLNLLLAMCRGADLVILDEPTEGLDPVMVEEVLSTLVSLVAEQETTIFFSSHQLHEVEQIADRVCLIHEGRAIFTESLDDLRARARRITAIFDQDAESVARELQPLGAVRHEGRTVSLLVHQNPAVALAKVQSMQPATAESQPVTLKDLFLEFARSRQ